MKSEKHRSESIGWLRAAVLGANDGIISTASLLTGVAAAGSSRQTLLVVGISGLCAGALSMAAGEFISVSSQSDTEHSDLKMEKHELENDPVGELRELAKIYEHRGLSPKLALQVANELTDHDALGAHARDELGINDISQARPLQAAVSSAISFAAGALIPVAAAALSQSSSATLVIMLSVVLALVTVGLLSAKISGASPFKSVLRVTLGGAFAMSATALIGHFTGHPV